MVENPDVTATDDPELAKQLGFDHYDEQTGQWTTAPLTVEEVEQRAADERDGETTEETPASFGGLSGHAFGTVTPGEQANGEGVDEGAEVGSEVDGDEQVEGDESDDADRPQE